MPPATVKALLAGADIAPKLHAGGAEAVQLVAKVNAMGISTDALYVDLQKAGVKSFADSYRELLDSIETKRKSI
jgi:transaldolase